MEFHSAQQDEEGTLHCGGGRADQTEGGGVGEQGTGSVGQSREGAGQTIKTNLSEME